jgi:hypothetical protein
MATKNIEAVKAGEEITITYPGALPREKKVIVKSPCDNKTAGIWYCVTHQEGFPNNFMKDNHIEKGEHRLVWICQLHGAEQP